MVLGSTFVNGPVYERRPIGSEAIFFERHYDREALADRLLSTEWAEVIDVGFWGEGAVRMEALLNHLGPLRLPLSPLEGLLGSALLHPVEPDGRDHPMAAFVTLRRR